MRRDLTPDEHAERRRARMKAIDALPADIRTIVHEEGWTVVNQFLMCGVTKAKVIKHLIRTVRDGSFDGGVNPLQRERVDNKGN